MSKDQAEYIAQKCIEFGRKTSGHLNIFVYLPKMATQHHLLDIMFVVDETPINTTDSCKINVIIE